MILSPTLIVVCVIVAKKTPLKPLNASRKKLQKAFRKLKIGSSIKASFKRSPKQNFMIVKNQAGSRRVLKGVTNQIFVGSGS